MNESNMKDLDMINEGNEMSKLNKINNENKRNELNGRKILSHSQISGEKEYYFNGVNVIKLIYVIIQLCFISYAISHMENNVEILIPLPTGFWLILSIIPNIIVFTLHIFENAPSLTIKTGEDETIKIKYRRFLKNKEFSVKYPEDLIETRKIHETTAWTIVYFLGFGWNLYLMSQGIVFLRIHDNYQGIPFFTYGLMTFLFYLLMYFLPEREFIFYDEKKIYGKFLLLPPLTFTIVPKSNNRESNNPGKLFKGILQIRDPWLKSINSKFKQAQDIGLNQSSKTTSPIMKNKLFILQTLIWFIFWFMSSDFTFSLYHYQFIQPLSFVLMAYNLRLMLYKDKSNDIERKPLWLYIFWIMIFYEAGIKFWYVTALVYLNSALFGWSVVASWILYGIILGITLTELYNILKTSTRSGKSWRISLIVLFIIALILEFTAFLSTLGIIPFYLSVLEIGPFA